MIGESNNPILELKQSIEGRIREQLEQHPHADRKRIIDEQLQRERENLEKILAEEEDPETAKWIELVIEWLPEIGSGIG